MKSTVSALLTALILSSALVIVMSIRPASARVGDRIGNTGSSNRVSPKATANWTIMVYLDADNNLEEAGIEDFLEMASVALVESVNVVVQMDRIDGHDESYGDWTDCRRFFVTHGTWPTPDNSIVSLGEVNMGDPNTLIDFAEWTIADYPANNYLLVLWDHGGGCMGGVCYDSSEPFHDPIELDELEVALEGIDAAIGGNLAILGFDACLMETVEVAYQVKDSVDIIVGSEEVVPNDGWPYDDILSSLTSNPSMTPRGLASQITNLYSQSYQDGSQGTDDYVTMAAFSESQIVSNVVPALNIFAQQLSAHMIDYHAQIASARNTTESFNFLLDIDRRIYYDVYGFAHAIHQTILQQPLRTAAQNLMNAIVSAQIGQFTHGPNHLNSQGLSIYWPVRDQYNSDYEEMDFPMDTQWDEFLQTYYRSRTDLAIIAVALSRAIVSHGLSTSINMTVENQGDFSENASLLIYANQSLIGSIENITLARQTMTTLSFVWNTLAYPKGDYTISVTASTPSNETDLSDNTLIDGLILVTIAGDVDGDHDVDIFDIVQLASCYGSEEGDSSYDSNCDLDGDRDIDIFDLVIAAGHYGDSW